MKEDGCKGSQRDWLGVKSPYNVGEHGAALEALFAGKNQYVDFATCQLVQTELFPRIPFSKCFPGQCGTKDISCDFQQAEVKQQPHCFLYAQKVEAESSGSGCSSPRVSLIAWGSRQACSCSGFLWILLQLLHQLYGQKL